MPVELFTDGLEPDDPDPIIWRFLDFSKFSDLIKTSELYFRRADLLGDQDEGIPPEEYQRVLGLNPYDLNDRHKLAHDIGSLAQFRESFFLNCWYLFNEETAKMWKEYAGDGVAICSRYRLLKAALETCEGRPHLGLVRYGSEHLTGWNIQRFITTKQKKYAHEREVRAGLWIMDALVYMGRHFDAENVPHSRPLTPPPDGVPTFQRRKVDLQALLTNIVVSPYAAGETLEAVETLIKNAGYQFPVQQSELARYANLLP